MTFALTCANCNQSITDLYYLRVGASMTIHLDCLKCAGCATKLEMHGKCYMSQGLFYCPDDYEKLRRGGGGSESTSLCDEWSCKQCGVKIDRNEYVIRVDPTSIYHPNCFVCNECHRPIVSGEKHGIYNNSVYCIQHFFKFSQKLGKSALILFLL